jgi:thiol-disulfide isomerase/thioredoxin
VKCRPRNKSPSAAFIPPHCGTGSLRRNMYRRQILDLSPVDVACASSKDAGVSIKKAPACRGELGRIAAVVSVVLMISTATAVAAHCSTAVLKLWQRGALSGFALPAVGSSELRLASQHGRDLFVHFFATWCHPCRDELPALRRLAARADPNSIAVLAVSVAEVELTVRRFLESTPVNFPVLLDRERAVGRAWQTATLPSAIILDADLQPRLAVEGDFAWAQVEPGTLIHKIKLLSSNQTKQNQNREK